jgi:hypothetical protein
MKQSLFSTLINDVVRHNGRSQPLVKMLIEMDPDGRKQKGNLTHSQYDHLKKVVAQKGLVKHEA